MHWFWEIHFPLSFSSLKLMCILKSVALLTYSQPHGSHSIVVWKLSVGAIWQDEGSPVPEYLDLMKWGIQFDQCLDT